MNTINAATHATEKQTGSHLNLVDAGCDGAGAPQVPHDQCVAVPVGALPQQMRQHRDRLRQRHAGQHPLQDLQGIQIHSCTAFTACYVNA